MTQAAIRKAIEAASPAQLHALFGDPEVCKALIGGTVPELVEAFHAQRRTIELLEQRDKGVWRPS